MLSFSVFVSIHHRSSHFRLPLSCRTASNLYAASLACGSRLLLGSQSRPIIIQLSPLESALIGLPVTAHSKGFSERLKSFRMRTYAKPQGGGAVIVNQVTVNQPSCPSLAVDVDDILYILWNGTTRQ